MEIALRLRIVNSLTPMLSKEFAVSCEFLIKHTIENTCISLYLFLVHIQYKFPVPPEQEAARWSKILHQNMNAKCRNVRAAAKPKVTPETGIVVHADA